MRSGDRLSPEQRAKICKLSRDGIPVRILVERFGASNQCINDLLRQARGPSQSDSRPPLESVRSLRGSPTDA